jgi:hypothetical protein
MELSHHINSLQHSLKLSAAPAGEDIANAADLLAQSLEPAARLSLLEAMSEAADEITLALDHASVDARLHGQEIEFVVSEIADPIDAPAPAEPTDSEPQADVARITLRLPESLKALVEQAATQQSISVNGWLVNEIASAVENASDTQPKSNRGRRNRSFRGFARS